MRPIRDRRRKSGARLAGGWLITYADLMTILVCFFVLIVSYSIQDQVKMEVVAGSMRDAFGVAEDLITSRSIYNQPDSTENLTSFQMDRDFFEGGQAVEPFAYVFCL